MKSIDLKNLQQSVSHAMYVKVFEINIEKHMHPVCTVSIQIKKKTNKKFGSTPSPNTALKMAASQAFLDFDKSEIDLRLHPKQLMLHESCYLTEEELVALCKTRELKLSSVSNTSRQSYRGQWTRSRCSAMQHHSLHPSCFQFETEIFFQYFFFGGGVCDHPDQCAVMWTVQSLKNAEF